MRVKGAIVLGGLILLTLLIALLAPTPRAQRKNIDALEDSNELQQLAAIEAREAEADRTFWKDEVEAQGHESFFVWLWDSLNQKVPFPELLAGLPVEEILLPAVLARSSPGLGLEISDFKLLPSDKPLRDWSALLTAWSNTHYRVAQSEWRQIGFEPAANGPASTIQFAVHLEHPTSHKRLSLDGKFILHWHPSKVDEPPLPRKISLESLRMTSCTNPPLFKRVAVKTIAPQLGSVFIDPLIAQDLDHDGRVDIVLACRNLVYWNRKDGRFEGAQLCPQLDHPIFTAAIVDIDSDGFADFVAVDAQGMLFFPGAEGGRFDGAGIRAWTAPSPILYGQVLTFGDVDRDGDLDVWLAQYKPPFYAGQNATPFYDANDGFPSYLLLNEGRGHFRDGTAAAGLSVRQHRRTYSSSLFDLNGDSFPDLVVVSDFAGLDVYLNDGKGQFTECGTNFIAESHLLGMGHSFGDFDRDGKLDLFVVGMNSPTVDRLAQRRASRSGHPDYPAMLSRMTHGNRLYLGREGGFEEAPIHAAVARTGWSWGSTGFDFNNDGALDLYVANGHSSNQSVRDYEPQFWTHDIYVGTSQHNRTVDSYFKNVSRRTRGSGWSYGGYEKNRLLMNLAGKSFVETGYLLGVALEEDCRNVVSEDLDGDGKMDLLVTTYEVWPERKQTLHIFRNQCPDSGNWIGFRFRDAPGFSPIGTRVTLNYAGRKQIRVLVTGDSHRSQHSNSAHFGLGRETRADAVEIHWPNGKSKTLQNPGINQYHDVGPD